jgi:hypothetical protein
MAFIPSSLAFLKRREISAAPSSNENWVWTCRWEKSGILQVKLKGKFTNLWLAEGGCGKNWSIFYA